MAELACDRARAEVSAGLDGEPVDPVLADHIAGCAACRSFESSARLLRASLRFDVLDDVPDVAPAVLDRVASRRPAGRGRVLAPVAAAFVAGALAGAAFVWPDTGTDPGVAAAELPAAVVAAQADVSALAADLVVEEPDGTRTGTLQYRAPEQLALTLGDARLLADGSGWQVTGTDQDGGATGVEPFADVAPLDLVLPASAFLVAATPELLGEREIDGHQAVGIRVTAAQVDAVVAGLRTVDAGGWVHPTDVADLWLDRARLVPVRLEVRSAPGPERARWAAARGRDVAPDAVVLAVGYDGIKVNNAAAVESLPAPAPAGARDHGFVDGEVDAPAPTVLPDGMSPWRSGTVGDVAVRVWTDGRAWAKVRATRAWEERRLFGVDSAAVRTEAVPGGVLYVADGGRVVAVHGDDVDLVVTGSLAPATLRRVAASIPVPGRPVPGDWAEATSVGLDAAGAGVALLVLPNDAGFTPPAVRLDGETASLAFYGAGDRALVLATRAASVLRPPLDPDAVGVAMRGTVARWSPGSGDLEWIESGQAWSLRSTTIGLAELVALAERLVTP